MADSKPKEKTYGALVASLLQDVGYRAKLDLDEEIIRSSAGGYNIIIFPRMDASFPKFGNVQFRCSVVREGTNVELEHVNRYNRNLRFCKMYLDDDRDIIIESDFFFDALSEDASQRLESIMLLVEGSISELKQTIASSFEMAASTDKSAGGRSVEDDVSAAGQ
ncbi:YbjN domain-containing protein [Mesorhizobium sp. M0598]|uniref:YbjN domain-containing protein n=1 Tax=Mesorhizobium sp. M0598 TaxID=2956968 RepID=UPI00333C7872